MRAGGADDGRTGDVRQQGIYPIRFIGLHEAEGHGQVGLAKGVQGLALVEQRDSASQVPFTRLGQDVQDKGLPVGLPVAFHVLGPGQAAIQEVHGAFHYLIVHREAGSLRLDHTQQHVSGQERI